MERLKELRNQLGITQQNIADALKVSRPAYTKWENGERQPDFDTLLKLADFFNVSADYLLENTDDPTPPTKKGQKKEAPKGASGDELKFALFGGDSEDITDEMYDEVKNFAEFIKKKYKDEIEQAKEDKNK